MITNQTTIRKTNTRTTTAKIAFAAVLPLLAGAAGCEAKSYSESCNPSVVYTATREAPLPLIAQGVCVKIGGNFSTNEVEGERIPIVAGCNDDHLLTVTPSEQFVISGIGGDTSFQIRFKFEIVPDGSVRVTRTDCSVDYTGEEPKEQRILFVVNDRDSDAF